jgi:hypothetical protein
LAHDPPKPCFQGDSLDVGLWANRCDWFVSQDFTITSNATTTSAPGTGLFEALIGDSPALIMLDELARHLRSAMAVPTVTGKSTLADQVTAFLMSLLEFGHSHQIMCLTICSMPVSAFFVKWALSGAGNNPT